MPVETEPARWAMGRAAVESADFCFGYGRPGYANPVSGAALEVCRPWPLVYRGRVADEDVPGKAGRY